MKKNYLILFLTAFSLIIFPGQKYAAQETLPELKLFLGQLKFVSVARPTRIVIGNPSIADVSNVTNSEITLTPKATGSTMFTFEDNFGEQSFRLIVAAEDMGEVKRRVDNMISKLNLPGIYTKAEDEEGKVLLLGSVKNSQEREFVSLALGPLKDKTVDLIEVKEEETIVEIAVEVLELDKGVSSTLGFTWPSSLNLIETGSPGLATVGSKWSELFKVSTFQRGTSSGAGPWTFKLDALVQEGKARILSKPRLACQSGKEAELMVGGEKPIFTTTVSGTTGATGTQVEYKEFGIKLKIKPVVTKENRIKLGLDVEVSEVGEAEFIGSTANRTAQAYPLSKRNATTELYLDDGQMMAIGGIIKQKTSEDLRKLPWLADIPLVGLFFRQKTTLKGDGYSSKGDAELFITLTPKVVTKENAAVKEKEKQENPQALSVEEKPVDEATAKYAQLITRSILENLTYPDSARDAGFQGTVKLSLRLSSKGDLLTAIVKSSSGYKMLDDNALETAKRMVSYPSFPPALDAKDLWIEVPIVYQLD